jgi:hypothetical protein
MNCTYANILGTPGEGVHAVRFMGLALYDLIGTLLFAILTSYWMKIHVVYSFLGWLVLAEVLHYLFGVQTALLRNIGLSPKCTDA